MKFHLMVLFLFIPLWAASAGGSSERRQPPLAPMENQPIAMQVSYPYDKTPEQKNLEPQIIVETRAETIFRALAQAYPDRVRKIEFYDGDWTIVVYGERFFYASGRLLPASLRDRAYDFAPLPFYSFVKELPPWTPPTEEESARMREIMQLRQTRQVPRAPYFFDTLWRSRNRDEAWEQVKSIRFLGHWTTVHNSILTQLSLVEQHILRAARTDAEIRRWIDNIASVGGWSWRNIASTGNRSFHAYGAAIDILPRSNQGLAVYWLWTARYNPEWWTVPFSKRLHPPEEVVRIFQSFGFIWGGKWRFFDTIHFEYRPEILILNNIPLKDLRDLR